MHEWLSPLLHQHWWKTAMKQAGVTQRLMPSDKNNAIAVAARKPPSREVASRYKSGVSATLSSRPATPKRSSSPNADRSSPAPGITQTKRAQSAERKRPVTSSQRSSTSSTPSSRPSTPSTRASTPSSPSRSTTPVRDTVVENHNTARRSVSGRTPDGLWPSMRNLSSSLQLESVTNAFSKKEKVAGDSSNQTAKFAGNGLTDRKRSPLRGRNTSDQSENSKPLENSNSKIIDHHRWPAMLGGKLSGNALSRSADLSDKVNRSVLSSRGSSPRRTTSDVPTSYLQQSSTAPGRRTSLEGNAKVDRNMKSGVSSSQPSQRSSSTGRPSRTHSIGADKDTKVGVTASSQFPERPSTGTRSSRVQNVPLSSLARPSSPAPRFNRPSSPGPRLGRPSSPAPSISRPSSPSKTFSASSSNRAMLSPSRTRPAPISASTNGSNRLSATSSILNYISDLQKGKKNANHVEDAHQLRLLHSVDLQWRFVNAQANETMMIQKMYAENSLQSMWSIISSLCESIIMKRIDVQYLQQEMKLGLILNEQLEYLELWSDLEREHCISLSEAVEALRASTLRLPVTGGAKADIFDVKNAVSSAVDVMQAMGTSICYLIAKVEGRKTLLSDLSVVAAKANTMLDECRDLLGSAASLQVQEASLITHRLQIQKDACKAGIANCI